MKSSQVSYGFHEKKWLAPYEWASLDKWLANWPWVSAHLWLATEIWVSYHYMAIPQRASAIYPLGLFEEVLWDGLFLWCRQANEEYSFRLTKPADTGQCTPSRINWHY